MNEKTKEKLKHFTGLETWSSVHPTDEARFNDFIIEAYNNDDLHISRYDFMAEFPKLVGDLEDRADKFFSRYENSMELLRQFHK